METQVIVHDDLEFCNRTVAAPCAAGHDVIAFTGSMAAISALDASEPVEVPLTRVLFPVGQPTGCRSPGWQG